MTDFLNKDINPKFKTELIEFLRDGLTACSNHLQDIEDCKTYSDLSRYIKQNNEVIADFFNYESDCDCDDGSDDIEELEDECKSLYNQISELEKKYECFTYWEELNLELFNKYKDKYTPWELEKLLENGKK